MYIRAYGWGSRVYRVITTGGLKVFGFFPLLLLEIQKINDKPGKKVRDPGVSVKYKTDYLSPRSLFSAMNDCLMNNLDPLTALAIGVPISLPSSARRRLLSGSR